MMRERELPARGLLPAAWDKGWGGLNTLGNPFFQSNEESADDLLLRIWVGGEHARQTKDGHLWRKRRRLQAKTTHATPILRTRPKVATDVLRKRNIGLSGSPQ